MKKIPIFVAALLTAGPSLSAEKVPSLVIGHWYGNDSYPVSLSDFNRIEIGDDHYTLKANNTHVQDQTLSYSQYPRFWVEDVEQKDIVTSEEQITAPAATAIIYNPATQELKLLNGKPFAATVFNVSGQTVLRGTSPQDAALSVAALPDGVYLAKFQIAGEYLTLKFVKH